MPPFESAILQWLSPVAASVDAAMIDDGFAFTGTMFSPIPHNDGRALRCSEVDGMY